MEIGDKVFVVWNQATQRFIARPVLPHNAAVDGTKYYRGTITCKRKPTTLAELHEFAMDKVRYMRASLGNPGTLAFLLWHAKRHLNTNALYCVHLEQTIKATEGIYEHPAWCEKHRGMNNCDEHGPIHHDWYGTCFVEAFDWPR